MYLAPLSIGEVEVIIERRYQLLALPGKSWIRPVQDAVIEYLHQTFAGKIRYVMNAVTTLINSIPESYSQPLGVGKAMDICNRSQVQRFRVQRFKVSFTWRWINNT